MKRLAVLACAAGMLAGCGEDQTRDGRLPEWATGPTIEVIGRAYIEVPPNRAHFSVSYWYNAPTTAEASKTVVNRATAAAEAIREVTDGAVLITADLDVAPYYKQISQRIGEFEEELVENIHPDSLLGYTADASLDVTVLDPSISAQARGAALAAGPSYTDAIGFYLEPSAETQREVFRAAVADAQSRAELAAAATGRTLKRLLLIEEGQSHCLGYLTSAAGRTEPRRSTDDREKVTVTGSRIQRTAQVDATVNSAAAELAAAAGDFAMSADPEPQRLTATVCAVYAVR